ncbi:putative zona pellucida sperm-binding protein 3-like isoform 2 [Scophthalmus maximus]|uniref:Zona pellucida sperm-binding protein 3 n=1 Tax=Scophthalmus maximus TaxID=52904 RepID=A0A2U9CH89_SCOMX|nr:zona pellucida sperm-binding protein 3d.2 isoform X2 [Scophthalmus maximus]AWP15106.1 putative zona pellucida sperm-binding protein 3-like isoform 2 [Scophthalmus maximus]
MRYMAYLSWFVILPLLTAIDGGTRRSLEVSNRTARVTTKVSRRETPTLPPPYLRLPVFVDSSLPLVEREHFSPAVRGAGHEPVPEAVREILIPAERPSTGPPDVTGVLVRTSCKMNKMLVQVERSMLGTGEAHPALRLGTCQASNSTGDYLYFQYDFGKCGTKRTIVDDQVAYSNTLQYDPPKLQGPIRRAVPFTLSVACHYNRYQYTYKIGYKPKMQMRKIFKSMKNRAKFILTPRNAQWERLSPSDQYVLGKPMYFEAEAPSMSQDKRLYVHSCYVTREKSHTSTLQFPVVKNFGCMVESKDSHSRFILYKNNAVRFTVDAFLFKGMTDQLYMHCDMSVGSSVPSTTVKSCNYDTKAGRWVELYGSVSVCTCCDSSCSSAASTETKIISSKPWTIEPKVKLTTTLKRKVVSTTTTTAPPPPQPPQPETTREVTVRSMTSQLEETPMGKVADAVKEAVWPFRGGGVQWVEMEGEETKGKGSAVVDEEEITNPRSIFEEIFDFGK